VNSTIPLRHEDRSPGLPGEVGMSGLTSGVGNMSLLPLFDVAKSDIGETPYMSVKN
jgi:hypothetical protein